MRTAPKKGDCIVCQAPAEVLAAVNAAVWHEGTYVRTANYRAAGARAASQIATTMGPEGDRWSELDPKTITRHADHIEETWRELMAGDRMKPDEIVVSHEFGDVMDAGAELAMLSMKGLRDVVAQDPAAFAALRTKEAIAIAKVGIVASGHKEASRLKRNQQKIDVMALFAASAGFVSGSGGDRDDADAEVDVLDMRIALEEERKLIAAGG